MCSIHISKRMRIRLRHTCRHVLRDSSDDVMTAAVWDGYRRGLRLPDRVLQLHMRASLSDGLSTPGQPAGRAALLAAEEAFKELGWYKVEP